MFYYISGKLARLDTAFAVVDAGGVGYKLTISLTTYASLSGATENVTLFSHMSVREDGVELFGFSSEDELQMFKLLITVSGVGPKAAVSILSQLTPKNLSMAICSENSKAIAKANGVGPKTAARIVLELKDKLSKTEFADNDDALLGNSQSLNTAKDAHKLSDAQDALIALGYSRNEAQSVLKTIDAEKYELDDIIRLALKKIMK